jgi:hypothetical protein
MTKNWTPMRRMPHKEQREEFKATFSNGNLIVGFPSHRTMRLSWHGATGRVRVRPVHRINGRS